MAKKIVDEVLKYSIEINGNQAQKELFDIEKRQRELVKTNKDLRQEKARLIAQNKKGSVEWHSLNAAISANNKEMKSGKARMEVLRKEIGLTALTGKQLKQEASRLRLALSNMIPGSADFKRMDADLQKILARQRELKAASNNAGSGIGNLADKFNRYGALAGSAIAAATGVALTLDSWAQGAERLSDAQSDVEKTTGLTTEAVRELTADLDSINTRTPRLELLKLAEDAGRLGKESKEDVLEFVDVANQVKVALGDDLGGDEAIKNVGKLTGIFNVGARYGETFGEGMLRLGSAINEVSASGANQADFLVNYLKRISGVSVQAKILETDQIGLAAAFDESGQSVEVSATVMSKVITDMFTDTETYAKIAGVGVKEFTELLNTDANEALLLFLEGLNGNNDGLAAVGGRLNELGLEGQRATSVLASVASNTDLVRLRQEQANAALEAGTSLTEEYNKKNNNFAADLAFIKRAIYGAFVSSDVVKGMGTFFGNIRKGLTVVDSFEDKTRRTQAAVNAEIEALKNGEFTIENRRKFIKEINDQYGKYLPNLISEKDTYEDLVILQQKLNQEFEKKILYAAFEEEIKEAIEAEADALKAIYGQEKEIAKIRNQRNLGQLDLSPGDADLLEGTISSLKKLNEDVVANTDDTRKEIEEKYAFMFEKLGASFDEYRSKLFKEDPNNGNENAGGSPKPEDSERIKAEQEIQKFLDGLNEDELQAIRNKFQEALELAKKYGIDRQELEEALAKELRKKQLELDQKAQEFETQRQLELMESSMQQLYDYEYGILLQQREEQKLSKLEFDKEVENLELDHLQRLIDARKAMGQETLDLEAELTAAKLDEAEARIAAEEKQREAQMESATASAFAAASQAKSADEAKSAILNAIRDIIAAKIAETIATFVADQIASQGWLGLITGAAAGAAAGALFSAVVPSFDSGKNMHLVMDHKGDRYQAVQNENPKTGLYTTPQVSYSKNMMWSEQRPEILIDGPTTQRLLNFRPDVVEVIKQEARTVRGYANGNYPKSMNNAGSSNSEIKEALLANAMAMNRVYQVLDKGLMVPIGDAKIRDMQKKMDHFSKIEKQA